MILSFWRPFRSKRISCASVPLYEEVAICDETWDVVALDGYTKKENGEMRFPLVEECAVGLWYLGGHIYGETIEGCELIYNGWRAIYCRKLFPHKNALLS